MNPDSHLPPGAQALQLPPLRDPSFNTDRRPDPADTLLPAFASKPYTSHLPTPQSPNNFGRYLHDAHYAPESPMPHSGSSSSANGQRAHRRAASDITPSRYSSPSQQYMTPESSPHVARHSGQITPRYFVPANSGEFATPKQYLSFSRPPTLPTNASLPPPRTRLEPAPHISVSNADAARMVTPSSPASEQPPNHSSALSSPFMAKLSIADSLAKNNVRLIEFPPPADAGPASLRLLSPPAGAGTGPPPPAATPPPHEAPPAPAPGGEMERIRQSILAERMAQSREAEKRRPEYLKRAKRSISETDPSYLDEDDHLVGIMESPNKGRRLKLFQETSEESFEESLMAGGYGRYRTADWVRQPQPIALPAAAIAGSSNIVSLLEEAEEQPPSAKEIKKRKRLAAFKSASASHSKLCAVELEGKGRVIIDMQPPEEHAPPPSPEPTPAKKRANSRRKKKNADLLPSKKASVDLEAADEHPEKPNWPDTEFPWKLRTEERVEMAKAEEEERMRWIERFLDRDSDEDEEAEAGAQRDQDQGETASVSKFGVVYDHGPESTYPMGRGKMVPLLTYSDNTQMMSRRIAFPSDPADARAALLSKRSVRALSYRQRKRERGGDDDDADETVCVCHGKDDGRELVQCDACQTWYHLECIGVKNVHELGREEDPWFCRRCVRSPSPSRQLDDRTAHEPTFAPTDTAPIPRRVLDAPFFPTSLQASPNWTTPLRAPRTPPRNPAFSDYSYTWSDASRAGPTTPQSSTPDVRIYSSPLDGYGASGGAVDDSPFDPTSTPSRGIRFHAPFTTPKNTAWRAPLFNSPSRAARAAPPSAGAYPPSLDEPSPHDRYARPNAYDDSPIRRNNKAQDGPRHTLHSPSRSKMSGSAFPFLEESPVVRSLVSDRPRTIFEGGQRYDDGPIS